MSLDAANQAAAADIADLPALSETAASAMPVGPALDRRTRRLIEAPIAPTLLRLAAPNMLVMVVQASLGVIETYFVGWLGTAALAGVALVFPALMLMQMMSAGAVGGGIAAAIARALGAGRREDADRGPGAVYRDGRQRRGARRGADLFQHRLRRVGADLGIQRLGQCHSRHR